MRTAPLLIVLVAAGCVTGPARTGWQPYDPDQYKVREAICPVMEPSFERHVRADGRTADPLAFGACYGSQPESYWCATFAYRTPTGAVRTVSQDEGRRILTGVRADVLAAVEKTGVNVTWAPAPEVGAGPNPEGKFEIRYLRKLRDSSREVSGEIVGKLTPIEGVEPWSQVRVTFSEWLVK